MAGRPIYVVTDPETGQTTIVPRGDGGAATVQEAARAAAGTVGEQKWQPISKEQVTALQQRTRTGADVLRQARVIYRTERPTPEQIRSVALRDPRARQQETKILRAEAIKREARISTIEPVKERFPEYDPERTKLERKLAVIKTKLSRGVREKIALMKQQVPELYRSWEALAAQKIGDVGITEKRIEKAGKYVSELLQPQLYAFPEEQLPASMKRYKKIQEQLIIGIPTGIKRKPLKTVGIVAAMYFAQPLVAGAKYSYVKYVVPKALTAPPIAKAAITGVEAAAEVGLKYVLPTLYTSKKIEKALKAEREVPGGFGRVLGETIGTELLPGFIGAYYGARAAMPIEMKTYLETEIQKLPISEQQKYRNILKDIKRLSKTRTSIKDIRLSDVERLDQKSARTLEKYLLKNKEVIVGGTTAQRTQLTVKSPRPSDVDLYSKNPQQTGREIFEVLKAAGIKRVSMSPTTGAITIDGKKAVEIHTIQKLIQNIQSVQPVYRSWKTGIVETPKGIKILKLDIQAQRKLVGGYLEGRYSKDIPHLKNILKSYIKTAKLDVSKKVLARDYKLKEIRKIERAIKPVLELKPQKVSPPSLPDVTGTITMQPLYKGYSQKYPSPYLATIPIKPYVPYKPYMKPKVISYAPGLKPYKQIIPKPKKVAPYKPYKQKVTPTQYITYTPAKPEKPYAPYKPAKPVRPYIPYKPSKPYAPYIPLITKPIPTTPTKRPTPKQIRKILKKIQKAQLFQAWTKEKGKIKLIGKPMLKQAAIKFGEQYTGKVSLAATFGVKPTGEWIKGVQRPYQPGAEFRPYKIRGERRIPLRDIWIERRFARLEVAGEEVRRIQAARSTFFGASKKIKTRKRKQNMFFS